MEKPKVTAILPCYNHERFLIDRIESIFKQSYPVSEIIFLDDASIDNSIAVAKALLVNSLCPVKFITRSTNSGHPCAQWNRGIRASSNDFIWIAETDDSCHPFLVEKLVESITSQNTDFAWCQSRLIDGKGSTIGSAIDWHEPFFPGLFKKDFAADGNQFVVNYLSVTNLVPNASAAIFSKQKYIHARQESEKFIYAGDWLQWIHVLSDCKISYVAKEYNYFRQHSLTSRSKPLANRQRLEMLACMVSALSIPVTQLSHANNDMLFDSTSQSMHHLLKSNVFASHFFAVINFSELPFLNSRLHNLGIQSKLPGNTFLAVLAYMLIHRLLRLRKIFTLCLDRIRRPL
jgi:glycosyltransferase involved in cell wall biosynthesis